MCLKNADEGSHRYVVVYAKGEFHGNDFCEVVREVAGDLVEKVELIDEYDNKKNGKTRYLFSATK